MTTQTLHSFYMSQLHAKSPYKSRAATGWCVFFFFLTQKLKEYADGGPILVPGCDKLSEAISDPLLLASSLNFPPSLPITVSQL